MIEQMDGSYNNPYKFNAKELDEDTGLYYYSARYYNPRLSIWYRVDPLAEKYPEWSPYVYTLDNPIRLTDPDGKQAKDVIFIGTDKKQIRISAPGDNHYVNVPFALKNDRTLNIGMGDDPKRLAYAYTVQADVATASVIGGGAGLEMSVVNFTDDTYGGYSYVYAGGHMANSAGAQEGTSASIGGSFFVAYNNDTGPFSPASFEGTTTSFSLGIDVIADMRIGGSVSYFYGTEKFEDKGWHGVSLGGSVGVGESVNAGSLTQSTAKTYLINSYKPTEKRSLIDKRLNTISPITSAVLNPNPKYIYHSTQID